MCDVYRILGMTFAKKKLNTVWSIMKQDETYAYKTRNVSFMNPKIITWPQS